MTLAEINRRVTLLRHMLREATPAEERSIRRMMRALVLDRRRQQDIAREVDEIAHEARQRESSRRIEQRAALWIAMLAVWRERQDERQIPTHDRTAAPARSVAPQRPALTLTLSR